jgi:hypothetical protein
LLTVALFVGCTVNIETSEPSDPSKDDKSPAVQVRADVEPAPTPEIQKVDLGAAPAPKPKTMDLDTEPAPKPERVKADVGVGKRGRSLDDYDSGVEAVIAGPAKAYFGFREKAVFQIQIPQAMQFFKAAQGRAPKSHEEFMSQIIEANSIRLPELNPGTKYVYDPEKEELMVERRR